MERLQQVENSSTSVDEMVQTILGDSLVDLDSYITKVRACFMEGQELLDDALDKIVLQLPTYMYNVIVFAQQLEMRKGVATEHQKYAKNEALLNATGTVSDKQAKAENDTAKERITELAYKTAASIVQKKLDGAMAILDSAKKVQQRRAKERALTSMAGNAVSAF